MVGMVTINKVLCTYETKYAGWLFLVGIMIATHQCGSLFCGTAINSVLYRYIIL